MAVEIAKGRQPHVSGIFLRSFGVLFVSLCVVASASAMPCEGDINGDSKVTVDELIAGVNAALGVPPVEVARVFDLDGNGAVAVDELIAAVRRAIAGCTTEPMTTPTATPMSDMTPTSTASRTPTATETPTPTRTESGEGGLAGSFERSSDFDAAVANIPVPEGVDTTVSAMSVDLNGDGLLDILVGVGTFGRTESTWAVLQQAVDVWEPAFRVEGIGGARAVTDLNDDGYLDLLLSGVLGVAWGGPNGIDLRNVQPLRGAMEDRPTVAITPMDLDRDGLTDLATVTFGGKAKVFYQEPDGSFVGQELGSGLGYGLCPVDFDGDGLPDLLSMGDGPFEKSVNEGGAWRQAAPRKWVHGPPEGWPMDGYMAPSVSAKGTPMGCAWGELDGDPDLELWVSQSSQHTPIYDPQGTTWIDVGLTLSGISGYPVNFRQGLEVFWGVAIVDFDGDGRDDIAVACGNDVGHAGALGKSGVSHIALFVQEQRAQFREQSEDLGLDETGDFLSLVADDLDGDGRPDLLVGSFRGLPRLYLNRLERRGGTVVLQLEGAAAENAPIDIIGAKSRWTMQSGLHTQPLVGSRPVLFRGVGDEQEVDIHVHWPSGIQELHVVPRAEPWVIRLPIENVP